MRSRPRNVNPSPWRVQAELAGLNALYRPETMPDRIADEFRAGSTLAELRQRYVGYDVDAIIRERAPPGGEK